MAMKPKHKDRKADVAKDLARLKGMSNAQLARDDRPGASSPIGHGNGEEDGKERPMKSIDWHSLERSSRLARVMWPNLSAAEDQKDMAELARNEGRKSPMQARNEQAQSNQRSKWYAKDR